MSKRQLEQLSQTLDSIVEDLRSRQQAVGEEHIHLQQRLSQLSARQSHVDSLEEVLTLHRESETDLTARLDRLLAALDEKTQPQSQWLADELGKFESRALTELNAKLSADFDSKLASNVAKLVGTLPEQVTQKLLGNLPSVTAPPSLEEIVRELERVDARTLGTLTERLSASLQTAISVQLAPLSDDLPGRLFEAIQTAVPSGSGSSSCALSDFVRELEKFETRSMANLAARMTAGVQTAVANQLATLSDDLPAKIANAVAAAIPQAARGATTTDNNRSANEPGCDLRSTQLADELNRVKATLAETEALLVEALEHDARSSSHAAAAVDARDKLGAAQSDCIRLASELERTRHQLSQFESGSLTREQQLDNELVDALRNEVTELRSLLAAKEHDGLLVEELRAELAIFRSTTEPEEGFNAACPAPDSVLREQLERASHQIVELRTQNEELAEQMAQLQINTAPHGPMPHLGQEGLSWEERKRLLLQQLDAEQSDDGAASQSKRIEVKEILRTTEAELARRDREIAELRSLLAQQSDAREGMAVGAAAVAQLIEGDELIQQEREKLRAIQRSWDEKLRQAEIELSMERAKLARERLHLEEQKQQLEQDVHSATAATQSEPNCKTADARSRKWLSRLGLKDEP